MATAAALIALLEALEVERAGRERQATEEAVRCEQQAAEDTTRREEEWAQFFEELYDTGQRMLAPTPPGWRLPTPEVLTALAEECVKTPEWDYIDTLRNPLNLSANQVVGLVMTVDPEVAIRLWFDFPR